MYGEITIPASRVLIGDQILHNTFAGWKYCSVKEVETIDVGSRKYVIIHSIAYGKDYALDDPIRIRRWFRVGHLVRWTSEDGSKECLGMISRVERFGREVEVTPFKGESFTSESRQLDFIKWKTVDVRLTTGEYTCLLNIGDPTTEGIVARLESLLEEDDAGRKEVRDHPMSWFGACWIEEAKDPHKRIPTKDMLQMSMDRMRVKSTLTDPETSETKTFISPWIPMTDFFQAMGSSPSEIHIKG